MLNVSVIISAYNHANYIEECINSVLKQSLYPNNLEIIVVDDGSTDDTSQRVKKYSDKIKYIRKENAGQASGFNVGFAHSKGDIIVFLDADDYWKSPDGIHYLCKCYEKYNCDAVFYNLDITREGEKGGDPLCSKNRLFFLNKINENIYQLTLDKITEIDFIPYLATASGESCRRELCNKILPIPEVYWRSADSYIFYFSLLNSDIYYIADPLACYRQHKGQMYGDLSLSKRARINIRACRLAKKVLKIKYHTERAKQLTAALDNKERRDRIVMELKKRNVKSAWKYLKQYKTPKNYGPSFLWKIIVILPAIIPEKVYKFLKDIFFKTSKIGTIFLENQRKKNIK